MAVNGCFFFEVHKRASIHHKSASIIIRVYQSIIKVHLSS